MKPRYFFALAALIALAALPVVADPVPIGSCAGIVYYDDSAAPVRVFVLRPPDIGHLGEFVELLKDNCIEVTIAAIPVTPKIAPAIDACAVIAGMVDQLCQPDPRAVERLAAHQALTGKQK